MGLQMNSGSVMSTGSERPGGRAARATVLLLIATLLGAGCGLAWLPWLFRTIPNDLARERTILGALRSGAPRFVVFGDSRGEAGVDTRLLAHELGVGDSLAYNLCSHGQKLADSLLLYQELPPSATTIIQLVNREEVGASYGLTPHMFNALYLYGYRPNEQTRRAVVESFGATAAVPLEHGFTIQVVTSRWTLRQAADMLLRSALRHDLRLDAARDDLHFPTPFTKRIDEGTFLAAADELRRLDLPPSAAPFTPEKRRLIERMAILTARSGRKLVLVAAPIHPRVIDRGAVRYVAALRTLERFSNVTVIDLTTLLPDGDFIDPIHASRGGARKVTLAIADCVRQGAR